MSTRTDRYTCAASLCHLYLFPCGAVQISLLSPVFHTVFTDLKDLIQHRIPGREDAQFFIHRVMPDLCFYLCHIDIIPAQDLCITKRLIIIRLQLAVSFSECPCLLILTVASHPVAHTRFFRLLFRVFLRFLFQLFCAADHCFRAIPRCLCAHVQCACYLLPHIDKPSVRCLFDPDGCLPVYLKHVRGLSDAAVIRPSGAHNGSPSAVVKLRLLPVFPPFPAVEVLQILVPE